MRKQLNLIQLSRTLVPIFVMLFHANSFMNFYFQYDFMNLINVEKSGGVYYFFALSGFMVYYLHHKEMGSGRGVKKFLFSRFIKIFPIYWIWNLCILPFPFLFFGIITNADKSISSIMASLLLLPREAAPLLIVAWSLVHTVFFYLVFSLTFFRNKILSIYIPVIWIVISIAFSLNILSSSNYYINFLFNPYNLIFISGVACAFLVQKIKFNLYVSMLLACIGLIGFPLSWIIIQNGLLDINLQVTTTLSSILLILGCSSIDLERDIKIPKLTKLLGDASFSIYLTHFSIMSAICISLSSMSIIHIPGFLLGMLLMLISMIFGCLMYILVEKPLHKKLKNLLFRKQAILSKHAEAILQPRE